MAERRRRRRVKPAEGGGGGGRVFGLHACRAILDHRPDAVRVAWLLEGAHRGALAELAQRLERRGIRVQRAGRSQLDALTDAATHQGIILEVQSLEPLSLNQFEALVVERGNALRLLLLDQVEDPRNLGACLRSAAAAGVDAVVVPRDRAASLSPAAVKAAAGASEFVPLVRVTNLARTMRFLREAGVRIAGAAVDGSVSVYEAALAPPIAIALGSEGSGLRRLTRENCDVLFRIPMAGAIESLNVAVSTGIVLFESLRQSAPSESLQ